MALDSAWNKFGLSFFFSHSLTPAPACKPIGTQSTAFQRSSVRLRTLVSSFLALVIAVPLADRFGNISYRDVPRSVARAAGLSHGVAGGNSEHHLRLVGGFRSGAVAAGTRESVLVKSAGLDWVFPATTIPLAWDTVGGVILAIMILPIISSLTREVMTAVPHSQREAVLALGATRWEMIRMGVLRNARIGIVGAIILGLGRALGETMAVTMVIGNTPEIHRSLLSNGSSMAAVIANEFAEASEGSAPTAR